MKKILLVGDVILDIIPSVFPIDKKKILSDGETFVNGVTFQRGGCGGNFACVMKSIYPKYEVEFVSRIGDDQNGNFIVKEMEKYGVSHNFIRDPNVNTQITIAVSFQDGERHFITNLGGLKNFNIDDIDPDLFKDIDHLAYRGPWFSEKLLFKCGQFLKIAHEKGIPISLDLGFDPFWNKELDGEQKNKQDLRERIKKRKNAILSSLQYVDFLFGNEEEFKRITASDNLRDALSQILKKGVKTIVMHRGAKGAAIIQKAPDKPKNETNRKSDEETSYEFKEIPAARVEVKNPVGSGDTFDSIFIGQILKGMDSVKAATYASAGAAFSLKSEPGTIINIDHVKRFLDEHPEFLELLK